MLFINNKDSLFKKMTRHYKNMHIKSIFKQVRVAENPKLMIKLLFYAFISLK